MTPRVERESLPARIVVRRVQPERNDGASSPNRELPND